MSQNNALGYIFIDGTEGRLRGAILITDLRGIPLDFRYTEPIKQTRLQRILYGKALYTYLKEELLLQSLLESSEVTPQLWLCSDEDLLNPLKDNGKVKALFMSSSSHEPLEATGHVENTSESGVYLLQADKSGSPIKIKFPDKVRPEEVKSSASLLIEAANTMELLEPFNRLQKALSSLNSTGE